MFEHLQRYGWVLPVVRYKDTAELLKKLPRSVIEKAEKKAKTQTRSSRRVTRARILDALRSRRVGGAESPPARARPLLASVCFPPHPPVAGRQRMREILIAFLSGCGTRLYALTGIRSAARGGGTPWFLLWELLPIVPLLGFVSAVLMASDPASRISRGYGWLYLAVAAIAATAVVYAYHRRRTLAQAPGAKLKGSPAAMSRSRAWPAPCLARWRCALR